MYLQVKYQQVSASLHKFLQYLQLLAPHIEFKILVKCFNYLAILKLRFFTNFPFNRFFIFCSLQENP